MEFSKGATVKPTTESPVLPLQELFDNEPTSHLPEPIGHHIESSYSIDVVETVSLIYGYVPTLGLPSAPTTCKHNWEWVLKTLGFSGDPAPGVLSTNEKDAITGFLDCVIEGKLIPQDLDDLNPRNHVSLNGLYDFHRVERISNDLLVFHPPTLSACTWSLGVTPEVALYVVRYWLMNPKAHTILTICHRLLERGIPFHTFISLPSYPTDKVISKAFTPEPFRISGQLFSLDDFGSAWLQCKAVLTSPQGRAAVLYGGIVGRLVREFLSKDAILKGPSIQAKRHRGDVYKSTQHPGHSYWDDTLTQDEIAVICGTYVLYTGKSQQSIVILLANPFFFVGHGAQTSLVTWFPLPEVWSAKPSGMKWVDWTEADEKWFLNHMSNIHNGNFQPLTNQSWRSRLRGQNSARKLIEKNAARSIAYLDTVCN